MDQSRGKTARTLSVSTPALDVGPARGVVGGSSGASDVMQTLIDAANSTLKEVFRRCRGRCGLRGIRVGGASNPGPPKNLRRLRCGVPSVSEPGSTVPASVRDIHVGQSVGKGWRTSH